MNDYDIKLDRTKLVDLLSKKEGFSELLESVLNQVLEHQMHDHLGAEPYERSQEREGYRNGYRARPLYTRVGTITLRVPQTRDGSFSTKIFKRYQRHEQAFVLGLMEMYLGGVSTRKVSKITEEPCGVSFSKSTVSELSVALDIRLKAWRSRSLKEKRYPFLIVDALVIDVRRDEAVRSTGCLIAYGVNEDGMREPLDLLIADSESENSWSELFLMLKERGLSGVELGGIGQSWGAGVCAKATLSRNPVAEMPGSLYAKHIRISGLSYERRLSVTIKAGVCSRR